ncbi:DUF2235 domain-containing protein [Methylopila sp. M107]|uniref:DUF2235 domain-containing protein n=1 Tax=Methylopila sp. M107 TaxID=1101190 RepID=UPI000363E6EE|nr:DUF2235 domain-containing protein [Methylopila sp. M107]
MRNILIFSDGTGQAGGRTPDQDISNVYKLYRATRCDTDSTVDPRTQIAFYDAGLGADPEGLGVFGRTYRRLRNIVGSALGVGIDQNIIDCYAALVRVWRPGDRIFLIGFSRGAFTVRCVGGVLGLCGLPTTGPGNTGLLRDQKSAAAIAARAVKIYQLGAGETAGPKPEERRKQAADFRREFGSGSPDAGGESNAVPYFIGVFDTVGTIANLSSFVLIGAPALALLIFGLMAGFAGGLPRAFAWMGAAASAVALIAGLWTLLGGRYGGDDKNWRVRLATVVPFLKPFKFYDAHLHKDVRFARQALSIDENRDDFRVVLWDEDDSTARMDEGSRRMRQVWFAGVHSDIGGSYPEAESRLSDIALEWMARELAELPDPPQFAEGRLKIFPSALGMQHDELKAARGWIPGPRANVGQRGRIHESVAERFAAPGVQLYDLTGPYRPPGLKNHPDFKRYY